MNNILETLWTIHLGAQVATFLFNTGRIIKAVEIFNEFLLLLNGNALKTIKESTTPIVIYVYDKLLDGYERYKYQEAKQCYEKAQSIMIETGNNRGVGVCYGNLGTVFFSWSIYQSRRILSKSTSDQQRNR